ncbi:hypothetical protein J2J97_32405 (plasmid) [Rhizobium bangladeshense]|uniref:hypothetical protein n=1 Tax=Rhizobium bangladeshense TaxID=1138189 RepID=UPI001A97E512|nr:hypothetical protein [Rhizobium bangladeshense]QSY98608.1 hypothetical protein J2J97_32405 [Rhizobium bangladeshense]
MLVTEPVCIFNWKQNWERHKAKTMEEAKPELRRTLIDCLSCTPIKCRSGLTISAQASPFHYCSLRPSFMGGDQPNEWHMDGTLPTTFEVLVSWPEDMQEPWINPALLARDEEGEITVAGWVQIADIEETIAMNGGWVLDHEIPKFTAQNALTATKRALDL